VRERRVAARDVASDNPSDIHRRLHGGFVGQGDTLLESMERHDTGRVRTR